MKNAEYNNLKIDAYSNSIYLFDNLIIHICSVTFPMHCGELTRRFPEIHPSSPLARPDQARYANKNWAARERIINMMSHCCLAPRQSNPVSAFNTAWNIVLCVSNIARDAEHPAAVPTLQFSRRATNQHIECSDRRRGREAQTEKSRVRVGFVMNGALALPSCNFQQQLIAIRVDISWYGRWPQEDIFLSFKCFSFATCFWFHSFSKKCPTGFCVELCQKHRNTADRVNQIVSLYRLTVTWPLGPPLATTGKWAPTILFSAFHISNKPSRAVLAALLKRWNCAHSAQMLK